MARSTPVAALQTVAPRVGQAVLAALQAPQPPPPESILTALLSDIASLLLPLMMSSALGLLPTV